MLDSLYPTSHAGDEGVAALTACFEENPHTHINQICLDYNGISAEASTKLVAAMTACTGVCVTENMDTFAVSATHVLNALH